jgi:hypothetical protein
MPDLPDCMPLPGAARSADRGAGARAPIYRGQGPPHPSPGSRRPVVCCRGHGNGQTAGAANAAKFDAADALGALADEAGLTLIQMAVAIIGPRTMEHLDSYLAADGIELSTDMLDHIDEIVPPGVTINVADNMWNFGTTAPPSAAARATSRALAAGVHAHENP